jgi:glyoxylase-like metal-dependent hydrolase (beta-lactamase superfamily II)
MFIACSAKNLPFLCMFSIKIFTFNPFQENTYLLVNHQKDAIIIDPGCYGRSEQQELMDYIQSNNIQVKLLLNTHTHIDHVLGNAFIHRTFGLSPWMHQSELPVYNSVKNYAHTYGINYEEGSEPEKFISEKDFIDFGIDQLKILFTPGHSPGSICFYSEEQGFIIAGDVLFYRSIGRTDLPGGDHSTLLRSIKNELFSLPEMVEVFPGHGPKTSIKEEKLYNPFLNS